MSTEDKKPIDDNEPDKAPEENQESPEDMKEDPATPAEPEEETDKGEDVEPEAQAEEAVDPSDESDGVEEEAVEEQPVTQDEVDEAPAATAAEAEVDEDQPAGEGLEASGETEEPEVEETEPVKKKGFFRSWTFKFLVVIALFLLAVRLSLPIGIKLYAEKWLVENGADSAQIDRVRLSPFAGIVALEGVDIVSGGETVISNSTIFANMGMTSLFTRKILLEQAVLADVILDLEKNSDGSFRVGSYTLPIKEDGSGVEVDEAAIEAKDKPAWMFFSSVIEIENVTVRYKQPALNVELVIEEALIEKINTVPDDITGTVKLKGTLNGAPISLDLSKLNVIPLVEVVGQVTVTDFDLNELGELLAEVLDPFVGKAGIDGNVNLRMEDSDISAAYEGSISLTDADLGGAGWATAGTVSYDGKLSYDMKLPTIAVDVDGDLRAQNYTFNMPDPKIDLNNNDILISGQTTVDIEGAVNVESTASLTMAPTTYTAEGMKAGAGDTSWAGQILFNTAKRDEPLALKLDGQLSIAEPSFSLMQDKGEMAVGNNLLSWDGKIEYGLNQGDGEGSYVKTDGVFLARETFFKQPETVDLKQSELKVAGVSEVGLGKETAVTYSGDVDLGKSDVLIGDIGVSEESISWKGDLSYTLKDAAQLIGLKGSLDVNGVALDMAGPGLQVSQEKVALTPDMTLTLADKPLFAGKAGFEAQGLQVAQKDVPLFAMANMEIVDFKEDGKGGVIAEAVNFNSLGLPASEVVPVGVDISQISISGLASPDLASGTIKNITIDKPTVRDEGGVKVMAELAGVQVSSISVDKDLNASVAQVEFSEGSFLKEEGKDPVATLKKLGAEKISYSKDGGLVIDAVVLNSVSAQYIREKTQAAEEQAEAEPQKSDVEEKALAAGDAAAGEVAAVDVAAEELAAGDAAAGEVAAVDAAAEEVAAGDADTGEVAAGDAAAEEIAAGDTAAEEVAAGDAAAEEIAAGDAAAEEVAAGDADVGEVAAGGADTEEIGVSEADAGEVAAGDTEAKEARPIPVKINRIDVVGTNGLKFADDTLSRPYVTLFDLKTLELRDIDLNTPEQPFTYRLVGFFDKYVPLEITGEIAPVAKNLIMKQELVLRNYSMLHISPYTVDAIGTYFQSGIADLTSSLAISEGMIDMENNMVLKHLVAQSVGGELAAEVDNQLPVPLGLALSMLEDKNGIIDLDIPVKGQLADMNIGIWDLIWTPITKSISVAVTPYLAYTALGPAGAIAYFGGKMGGKMLTSEIPVLEFEKGSTELTEKHEKQLKKAAKIINKELEKAAKSEEEVDFTICAKVSVFELTTASDTQELNWELENNIKIRKELFTIGEARSLAVKDHLMQVYEVPDEKLLLCDPGLIFEEKKKPVIEFYR